MGISLQTYPKNLYLSLCFLLAGCASIINIEKNIFADEWIRHKIVSEKYIFTDSSITQEIIYNWDGNSYYIDIIATLFTI